MKDWVEILIRSISLFLIVLVVIRLSGKKHPVKMTPFNFIDYVAVAVIASLISVKVIQNITLGLIALGVWLLVPIIFDYLRLKSKWLHDWIQGRETILVKQGKVMEENLSQIRLTGEDLMRELRSKNVFNLSDVEFAVMETTGDINVLLKSDSKPVTPKDTETIYANIEKIHADLLNYSMETKDKNAKQMYAGNAEKLENIKNELKAYLLR